MIRPRSLDAPREESWAAHMQAGRQATPDDEHAGEACGGCAGDAQCAGCGGTQGGTSAALAALDWASLTTRATLSPFWRIASTAQAVRDAAGRDSSPDWIALDASLRAAHTALAIATDGRNASSAYADALRSALLPPDEPTMGGTEDDDGGGLAFPKQKPKAKVVAASPEYNTRSTTSKPCCCRALGIEYSIRMADPGLGLLARAKFDITIKFKFEIAMEEGGDCALELWEYTSEPANVGVDPGFDTKDADGEPLEKKNTWSEVGNFRGAALEAPKTPTDPIEGRSLNDYVAANHASKSDTCVAGQGSATWTDTPTMGDSSYLYQVVRWKSGCPGGGSAEVRGSIVGHDGRFERSPSTGRRGEAGSAPPTGGLPPNVDPPPEYWVDGVARKSRFGP